MLTNRKAQERRRLRGLRISLVIALLVTILIPSSHSTALAQKPTVEPTQKPAKPTILKNPVLPLQFVPNVGQYSHQAGQYSTNVQSTQVEFYPEGISYSWRLTPPPSKEVPQLTRKEQIKDVR